MMSRLGVKDGRPRRWKVWIHMQLQLASEFRALVFLRNFGCVGLVGGCSRILRGRLAF